MSRSVPGPSRVRRDGARSDWGLVNAAGPCPCGGAGTYAVCCAPFVRDGALAPSAEALMRSRYTAYVVGAADHLFRTWHPRTRPVDVAPDPALEWTRLEIREVSGGGEDTGVVEFVASWRGHGQNGTLHERSRFARRGGRWFYVGEERP